MTRNARIPLSDETRFVAACCRWPQDAAAQTEVHAAASEISDWDKLFKVCQRHRVVGLVHHAIRAQNGIPSAFSARIKFGAQKIGVNGVRQAKEAVRLENLMRDRDITAVQFKGPSLSQTAYESLVIKRSKDIDILVAAENVPAAISLLKEAGYEIEDADYPISATLSNALIRHRNQIELYDRYGQIVELHWLLANAPGLLPGIERQLSTKKILLAGCGQITTLDDADLFSYLCQHGALHDWSRLRWLADISAQFFAKGDDVIGPLMHAAKMKGAGLAAEQAQFLSHYLFATPAPQCVSEKALQLTRHALRRIEAPYERRYVWEEIEFNARRWWMQRHFYPSTFTALGLLKVHRASLDDIVAMPLPAQLDWLYPILRVPRWLIRRFTNPAQPSLK